MDSQLSTRATILRYAFGAMSTLAGLDKFFNILADWPSYVSPLAASLLPVSPQAFMQVVGIVELSVGAAILFVAPRLGTYVASVWLLLVAANLVLGGHFDIAVRDVVMSLAALALARVVEVQGYAEKTAIVPFLSNVTT